MEIGVDMNAFPNPQAPPLWADVWQHWHIWNLAKSSPRTLAKFSRPRSGPGAVSRQPFFGPASTAANIQRTGGHNSSVSRG